MWDADSQDERWKAVPTGEDSDIADPDKWAIAI